MLVSEAANPYNDTVNTAAERGVNMINENIKHFRKAKRMSQEEMAVRLNVVRQTVSKWENGLSVPDADIVIHMAELFEVSVSQLLGVDVANKSNEDVSEELAKLNEQLAKKNLREQLLQQTNRKRGVIISFSIAAMLTALIIKNEIISLILVGICMLASVVILYRNLALLTSVTTDDLKTGVLRTTTIFNSAVFAVGIIFAVLVAFDLVTFSENDEKMFAMALVSCVIIFSGIISPKLPYSKHTGLRLPWTVQDEDTWNVAHKVLGYIATPIALLYIACSLTISNFEVITLCAMVAWIGIPGIVSYLFYNNKQSEK